MIKPRTLPLLALLPFLALVKLTGWADSSAQPPDEPTDGGAGEAEPDGGEPPRARGACTVTTEGTAGLLMSGRLLLATEPVDGELLIDGEGLIQCADKSCATPPPSASDAAKYQAAYAEATQITCKDSVISPGLINPHD